MARRRNPETVLVSGASSGIGRALALEYARRGSRVMLLARREAELSKLCEEIGKTGGGASFMLCDVADPVAVREVVTKAEVDLGSLDMVIANAGVGHAAHAARLSLEDMVQTIDVNVRGAMATLMAAIPIMMAQKHGHLVGISSLAGRRALPAAGAYSASKAALSSFLETLTIDLAPAGIAVTDVQPGFVETEMTARNEYDKPLIWGAPKAARVIADRLSRGPRIIAFPWPLALLTRISGFIPFPAYAALTRAAMDKR